MAIERYRSVEEMPRPPRPTGERLLEAIAAAWERAHIRAAPTFPRGVAKFRSLKEAQRARWEHTRQRLHRLRGQAARDAR